jgi:hypothetical protein
MPRSPFGRKLRLGVSKAVLLNVGLKKLYCSEMRLFRSDALEEVG